jgi:hypothetical protein
MATLTGAQLARNINQQIIVLKNVCEGVDEETAQ